MKKFVWVIIVLLVGGYFVNSYIENKAKRKAEQEKEQRVEQTLRSSVEKMVSRTNSISEWESSLSKGETYRLSPILTVELEKLWLSGRPILFVGTIKDISTYDKIRYTVLFERNLLSSLNNMFSTELQLSLLVPKKKIDAFLKNHPKLFKGVGFNNGSVVIAKVKSIKTDYYIGNEGVREEIKIGQGELIDILFIGGVRL